MGATRVEDLGQLLLIHIEEDPWTTRLERLLRRYQPGGILLGRRNLRAPEVTAEMLAKIAGTLDAVPFLVLEEEGGKNDPLRVFFPPLPSPRAAARRGAAAAQKLGELAGAGLSLLGFNTDFAPGLDLSDPRSQEAHETQRFSAQPQEVALMGRAFVDGLKRHCVLACGKHFPGSGAVEAEAKEPVPVVHKTMADLWREDLIPFRHLHPQLRLMKVSHAAFKAYDFNRPLSAALSSSVLDGLLRVKLGYCGAAVADLFEFPASGKLPLDQIEFVNSIKAGCDILVVPRGEKLLATVFEALRKALDRGSLSVVRVEEALRRVRTAKKGIARPTGKVSPGDLSKLARQFEEFSQQCRPLERKIA